MVPARGFFCRFFQGGKLVVLAADHRGEHHAVVGGDIAVGFVDAAWRVFAEMYPVQVGFDPASWIKL